MPVRNEMPLRTEAGRDLLAGLVRQGISEEAVSSAIYNVEAEAGLGHETCPECGHRQRSHGLAGEVTAGCWAEKCKCKAGRPFADVSLSAGHGEA